MAFIRAVFHRPTRKCGCHLSVDGVMLLKYMCLLNSELIVQSGIYSSLKRVIVVLTTHHCRDHLHLGEAFSQQLNDLKPAHNSYGRSFS